jgi:hypothetical protein
MDKISQKSNKTEKSKSSANILLDYFNAKKPISIHRFYTTDYFLGWGNHKQSAYWKKRRRLLFVD